MELFVKIVNGWQPLTIFAKSFILDVCQGSEYAYVTNMLFYSILFYSILFYSILFLFYSILFLFVHLKKQKHWTLSDYFLINELRQTSIGSKWVIS